MTLSRRYRRLLPAAILVTSALACGCANTSQYGPGQLAYRPATQRAAGPNPFATASADTRQQARPALRTAQTPARQQLPRRQTAMAQSNWQQPQPPAMPANAYPSAQPTGGMAVPTGNQTAYFESPAVPQQSAPTYQSGAAGTIRQMGYSRIAADDPFAAVEGQPTRGVATVPATLPRASSASGASPYQWGTPADTAATEEFLPPIRQ